MEAETMATETSNPASRNSRDGWAELSEGQDVILVHDTQLSVEGTVDAITGDGKIVWITSVPQCRRIFHADDGYRVKD